MLSVDVLWNWGLKIGKANLRLEMIALISTPSLSLLFAWDYCHIEIYPS
jgi:hypothetical protein